MFRFFENLVDPYQPYDAPPNPPQRLFPFMWMYLRPFKRVFIILGIFSFITAGIEIFLIGYLGRVVDLLTASEPGDGFWRAHGTELLLAAIFILLFRPVIQAIDTFLQNNALLPNIGTIVRYRAHRHVLSQSVSWYEDDFAGRIANRIMQTPPAMGEAVFQIFDALGFATAYLIGAAILLMQADPRLALPLIVWVLLYAALVYWTVQRVGPASQKSSDARSQVTGRVVDSYTNIHSVKMFDHHDAEMDYATESIEYARETFKKEMRLFTLMDLGLVTLNGFLVIGVVGWAVWLWSINSANIGVVAAAAALTLRLNGMSGWIMWATTTFFRELGIIREGMETIAAPIELIDAEDAKVLKFERGRIEFDKVHHQYGRKTGGVQDLSLVVQPGEKIGLVGQSGAGKSTLIKLLLRFYDIESGAIRVDGQDISQVTQASLRSQLGVVQQDNSLLHRSVRDNILFGRPDASTNDLQKAIKAAHVDDFIDDLVDQDGNRGLDARVGERGVKLSGGQRQRISLARAILKDAPILILDEATAALDSEIEHQIQNSLFQLMEGKTVIAIAHRLSTVSKMDRIIVMDHGTIIEQGRHEDLLAQGGTYAKLWNLQSGGFMGLSEDGA